MQRYFGSIVEKSVILSNDDEFHLTKVMRAKINDPFEIVCEEKVFLAMVTSLKPFSAMVLKTIEESHELDHEVILICSLLKGEKMDFVVQKATELGVGEIVFVDSERSIVHKNSFVNSNKLDRYRKIAKEAAEQSKRVRIPTINQVISFSEIRKISAEIKLIAYEGNAGSTLSFENNFTNIGKNERIAVLIGPEGGFSEGEVIEAKDAFYTPISLGNRILRAETACIYALSIIANKLECK